MTSFPATKPGSSDPVSRRIPREVFFGNPTRHSPAVSPDGTWLAYIAPAEGIPNVWVESADGSVPARAVTKDRGRGITNFVLCGDERLAYLQDTDGNENWRLYLADITTGTTRQITPAGARAGIVAYHPSNPNSMVIACNLAHEALYDLHRVDLVTGEMTLIAANPAHEGGTPIISWLVDADQHVRGGMTMSPDGDYLLLVRDEQDEPFRTLLAIGEEDSDPHASVSFSRDGDLFLTTSIGAETRRLARLDLDTGQLTTVAEDPAADIVGVWADAKTQRPAVAIYELDRYRYEVLDPAFAEDLNRLRDLDGGDVDLVSSTGDGNLVVAASHAPDRPIRYYLYDRITGRARFLFTHNDELAGHRLSPVEPLTLTARDGLELRGYVTYPSGGGRRDLPAVVLVHGGPWMRDSWRYHPQAQWLADRGYLVVQLNYRGSAGYGKAFLNAGNREWGRAMHTDLIDAVDYLMDQQIVDPERVAIMGHSYGGYAALCGAALTPGRFAAAVSLCGPTDLRAMIESIPPIYQAAIRPFHARVGHPEHDADMLREASPLTHVEQIRTPLLIGQGANDPRAPKALTDRFVAVLERAGVPHQYLVFDNEGHDLVLPENRERYFAAVEEFLAQYLGPRQDEAGAAKPGRP